MIPGTCMAAKQYLSPLVCNSRTTSILSFLISLAILVPADQNSPPTRPGLQRLLANPGDGRLIDRNLAQSR